MAKILIVDDEQSVLSVLATLLETHGHEVVPALGGDVAIQLIEDGNEFDLMISDIRMNPVNGMQLLEVVHEKKPDTSVIMLTAYGQVETAIRAMELGAFDYVKKPFNADHLICTVDKALEYREFTSQNKSGAE
ncbi:hypothetical protein BVX94_01085 [bacterium B17]|nr:hypothetical protein BVX94_01085 [bacterium B17]